MSMLDRYRKPGGFVQLLSLVETCGAAKQEKFLEIIQKENPVWAQAIQTKILTIDRIYSWDDETLAEIFGTLQDLTVSVALQAASDELKLRISNYFSHGRKRKIDDLRGKPPTPAEIAAMHMKIVENVRKMEQDGYLRFEKFDPALVIEDDIEDILTKENAMLVVSGPLYLVTNDTEETPEGLPWEASEARLLELQALKKRTAELAKENAVLRHELSLAKSKLEQIKKIA